MQNIVWKLILIAAVLVLCGLAIGVKDLRLGRDLRGGVSLVYQVHLDPDETNPEAVLERTISVLKDRVNPQGVYDISMQVLGRDRIEVVMPLPGKKVRTLQKAYQDALDNLLRDAEINSNALDDALMRGAAVEEFGGTGGSERADKIRRLQIAYDSMQDAREQLQAATGEEADQSEIRRLERAVAAAELSYESIYGEVIDLSLGRAELTRALGLSTEPKQKRDENDVAVLDENGEPVYEPSPREVAIGELKSSYPHLADRIDELVAEHDAYAKERTGFDDPEDLMRLLQGAGVLEFRIAVSSSQPAGPDVANLRQELQEKGPANTSSPLARWFPINELKQWYEDEDQLKALLSNPVAFFAQRDLICEVYNDQYYLLLWDTPDKALTHGSDREWSVTSTYPSADQFGLPCVAFKLDSSGAALMGRLTGANLRKPMAIVLDGEIYSAPTIQSQISSNGQITGTFSQQELDYLLKVLAAGSLQATLSPEPISVSILGPSLGADNLTKGKEAFIISIIAVAAFMLLYYFFAGLVADLALIANGVIIFGVMMAIDGTFTLPGLAGIVLTIGMAVDANVLIYERIREEIFTGEYDLRGCIRQGYAKALSTILDGNITNLIVCMVLFMYATTEVKGFALTLTIGICATLFTALFVTRQIYYLYTDLFKLRRLPMLATVIPAIHRALEPSINWIGLRKVFWAVSLTAVIGSIVLVRARGADMFDTEFRGGVSAVMFTAPVDENDDGEPDLGPLGEPIRLQLRHTGPGSVEARIRAIGENASATLADAGGELSDEDRTRLQILSEFENSSVLTVGETTRDAEGAVLSSKFQIKVASPKGLADDRTITNAVVEAIVDEFGDQLDTKRPLSFDGAHTNDWPEYVRQIRKAELGQNLPPRFSDATQRVPEFIGGAAVLLTNVTPPADPEDVAARIDEMRNQPDFARYSGRQVEVVGLKLADPNDPAKGYRDLVVCVYDENRGLQVDPEIWDRDVAEPEWQLITKALTQPASLAQVSSFSSAVAETLSAQAIVAVVLTLLGILVYIWVRFGSLRYSIAAIVALIHDVTIALGLLALSGYIGDSTLGHVLLVEPFRIDLGVVAALLTIIGYSLNDTIVIMDRIRENRGKLPLPTAPIVNASINQTISRTLLTSVTTLIAVVIMYSEGGSGIRPFTFCLLIGIIVGTYSSVAIAAPLVFTGGGKRPAAVPERAAPAEGEVKPAGA